MTVDQMMQRFAADPDKAEWADRVVSQMVPALRARGWTDDQIVACFTVADRLIGMPEAFDRG